MKKENRAVKHGMSGTRPYKIWSGMKARCDNPNNDRYDDYGGRGISYDPKWREFSGFWEDMEDGYSIGLTLDRVDNDGSYCKENCRWATLYQQARNQGLKGNNRTGVTGVHEHNPHNKRYFRAQWEDLNGTRRSRCFNRDIIGDELAFFLARQYREHQLDLLNLLGAGYGDKHGL